MTAATDITRVWLEEAAEGPVVLGDPPDRHLRIWPFQLEIEGNIDRCESIAIWDGGIELRMKRKIPVGAHVGLRNKTCDRELPVEVRVECS